MLLPKPLDEAPPLAKNAKDRALSVGMLRTKSKSLRLGRLSASDVMVQQPRENNMSQSRFALAFFLIALSLAACAQTKPPAGSPDAAVAKTLQTIEQNWLNAEKNRDSATFEQVVADDWTAITPEGKRQTKAERSAEIKSSQIDSASLSDVRVRVFGDMAVVTGVDNEVTVSDGKKSPENFIWTDVFVKRNGKWVAVASQTAPMK